MLIGTSLFLAAAGYREASARPHHIAYRIFRSANASKDVATLQMEQTIENLGDDRQVDLLVPDVFYPSGSQFPKEKLFANFQIDLEVSDGQWVESSGTRWRVKFDTSDQPVVILYTLKQPYSGPPFDRKLVSAPATQPDYWHLSTSTSLMVSENHGPVALLCVRRHLVWR